MSSFLPSPPDDGLLTPEVGPWSSHKHHFLARYIDAFTTAMRTKWSSLHYIDLFAGAGIERIRGNGLEWGSPLIAAQPPRRFTRLHLCELVVAKYEALLARLECPRLQQHNTPHAINGDANEIVEQVVAQIPSSALSLAFLDPYKLTLAFETLRVLARRKVDLIIFFPDHMDALRNCDFYYADNPRSKLDVVLGGAEWRQSLRNCPWDQRAQVLLRIYEGQIRTLGYNHFEYERIRVPNGPFLYRLVFCSRHPKGAEIWRNTSRFKPDGQYSFDF